METISELLDKKTQMLSDGLKMSVGGGITPSLNNPLERACVDNPLQEKSQNQNTNEHEKPSDLLRDNFDHQKRLTSLLLICFDTLDTFGKEPEQLTNLEKIFQMVLGRFRIEDVECAFRQYLEKETVMPKPADIVKIVEPPVEPRKWCATTFFDIKKRWREGQFITDAEKSYCNDFVSARVKDPDAAGMIDDAVKQVEQQNRQYWAIGG